MEVACVCETLAEQMKIKTVCDKDKKRISVKNLFR